MNIVYILFVITYVNGGSVLHTQEFENAEACERARARLITYATEKQQSRFGLNPIPLVFCASKR